MQDADFVVDGPQSDENGKKLPYVPPWKTFSKLLDDEKEPIFNSMREKLILAGLMDNK